MCTPVRSLRLTRYPSFGTTVVLRAESWALIRVNLLWSVQLQWVCDIVTESTTSSNHQLASCHDVPSIDNRTATHVAQPLGALEYRYSTHTHTHGRPDSSRFYVISTLVACYISNIARYTYELLQANVTLRVYRWTYVFRSLKIIIIYHRWPYVPLVWGSPTLAPIIMHM